MVSNELNARCKHATETRPAYLGDQRVRDCDECLTEYIERVRASRLGEPSPDYERVAAWMRDPKRPPAHTAFTAGAERQLAYAFEDAVRGSSGEPSPQGHPSPPDLAGVPLNQ